MGLPPLSMIAFALLCSVDGHHFYIFVQACHESVKVPLRRKFVGLFRPKSVAEYRVVSIFTQKTEQETVHPNIF